MCVAWGGQYWLWYGRSQTRKIPGCSWDPNTLNSLTFSEAVLSKARIQLMPTNDHEWTLSSSVLGRDRRWRTIGWQSKVSPQPGPCAHSLPLEPHSTLHPSTLAVQKAKILAVPIQLLEYPEPLPHSANPYSTFRTWFQCLSSFYRHKLGPTQKVGGRLGRG